MAKSAYEKQQNTFNLAKHYGIDLSKYSDDDGNPRTGIGGAEMIQLKKDVATAASNDYDLRETLTAAASAGKSKAQKILKEGWNYKDLSAINNAHNFQEKAAKRHGQGGNFETASDAMGLTRSMQDKAKDVEIAEYKEMFAPKKDDNDNDDQTNKFQFRDMRQTAQEKSPELKAAEDLVAQANRGPSNIYAQNNSDAPTHNTSRDAASSFLYDYRNKLVNTLGSPSDTNAELAQAARIVSHNHS